MEIQDMNITINGEQQSVADQVTVAALIQHLELNPDHLVVELNQRIIMSEEHPQTYVVEGDCLELVQFVGGG
jgi:thiamine biosynthesis protein ThiS